MSEIGKLIKKIRLRSGLTQAQFAATIGVKQNTVSLYERGSIVPGDSVLTLLYLRAQNQEELEAIASSMEDSSGLPDAAFQSEMYLRSERFALELKTMRKIWASSPLDKARFLELAVTIGREDYVPPWLVEFLYLWITSPPGPDARDLFASVVNEVKYRLSTLNSPRSQSVADGPPYDVTDPRYTTQILWLMMECPTQNDQFFTGFSMTQAKFDSVQIGARPVSCPFCGTVHTWDKSSVSLSLPDST